MDFSHAILTEQEAATLQEQFPRVVSMSMGAEAVLPLLERLELDPLAERLHVGSGRDFRAGGARRP